MQSYPQQQPPPAQTNMVFLNAPNRPPSYMWLACLTFWCCNMVFGGVAFILSIISNSSADDGNYESATQMGKASMWVSVAGIAVSVITIIIIIVYFVAIVGSAAHQINNDIQNAVNNANPTFSTPCVKDEFGFCKL